MLITESQIECSDFICNRIRYGYKQQKFEDIVSYLLELYFAANAVKTNAAESEISGLSFTVLVSFILILTGVFYKQYKIKKEIDAKTIYIKNPMVIIF